MGWLNYGAGPPITTVPSSGTYVIGANSVQDSNPKALKILKSVDTSGNKIWYYVEFRMPVGFDSSMFTSLMNGVMVTMDNESVGRDNFFLDMTPLTALSTDGALQVGQSFTDPDAGVTITLLSVDGGGATISVTLTPLPCSPANPSVTVNPATMQQVIPGGTLSYSLTVTNNNSSSCTGNSFNIQPAVPLGWGLAVASPVLDVAPGASAATTVQVTVPTATAEGFYSVGMNVSNQLSPDHAASVAAGISVSRPNTCLANPTVVNPSLTQWRRPGSTVSYTVTVTNNNSSGCTSNSFRIQPAAPNGWTVIVAAPILNITPGGRGSTTLQVSVPAGTSDNFYSVVITAANTTSPTYAASAAGIVAVYSSLGVGLVTDQPIYTRGQTASVNANITAIGTPMAGAAANFTITKPNGRRVSAKVTSGANGTAIYKYKSAGSDPIGTYTVSVDASLSGALGAGSTTFQLR